MPNLPTTAALNSGPGSQRPKGSPGPRRAADCWIPAAIESPPTGKIPGPPLPRSLPRSLPHSLPPGASRARLNPDFLPRAGKPRADLGPQRTRSQLVASPTVDTGSQTRWQWAGAAGSLSPFRERLSNSCPRRGATWAAERAVPVRSQPGGHRSVSILRFFPSPSAGVQSAKWQYLELRWVPALQDPRSSYCGLRTWGHRGRARAVFGVTLPAERQSAGEDIFCFFSPHPGNKRSECSGWLRRGSV